MIQLSGFLDMTDADALFYVQSAQRYLESRVDRHNGVLQYKKNLAIGDWNFVIPGLLSVNKLYYTSSDSRVALVEKSMEYFKSNGLVPFDAVVDTVANGTPSYWTFGIGIDPASDTPNNEDGDDAGTDQTERSIIIGTPPDTAGTLTVIGRFKAAKITADGDTNFWTELFPEALIYAGLMYIEGSYRNREGVNDYKVMVKDILETIDYDEVEHDYQTVNRIL